MSLRHTLREKAQIQTSSKVSNIDLFDLCRCASEQIVYNEIKAVTFLLDNTIFYNIFILGLRLIFKVPFERHLSSYGFEAVVCVFVFAVKLR